MSISTSSICSIQPYSLTTDSGAGADGCGAAVLSHLPLGFGRKLKLSWVRDADDPQYTEADALAASGDYLQLLAGKLDLLAQSMPRDSSEQIEMEHIISTLFYLDEYYSLVAKKKLHR